MQNIIPKLFWSFRNIDYKNMPFCIVETRQLDCQFGPRYYKEKPLKSSRVYVQGSRKKGCSAHITIKKCRVYPEYVADTRALKEKKMSELKKSLQSKDENACIATDIMYFVTLPAEECHSGHPTGHGVAGFSQKVNEKVAAKISELVAESITEVHDVRRLLKHYVIHDLCKGEHPNSSDRAYFPIDTDLRNHIYMAKRALQLSCLDQQNLRLKIDQWRINDPESTHFFRPFVTEDGNASDSTPPSIMKQGGHYFNGNDGGDGTTAISDSNHYEQMLMWVHQTTWQKQLLERYGNSISLIDATYKTTQYDLALFFICVKTNVGYSVVAEFIVQSETAENIAEALTMLKQWNPAWSPRYFMTDYSEAEIVALEEVFPSTSVYLCDFHREQSWDRWVRDRKHGLSLSEGEELLTFLRACAWAPPIDSNNGIDSYELAVKDLQQSAVWKNHLQVRDWLNTKWLTIPQVSEYNCTIRAVS